MREDSGGVSAEERKAGINIDGVDAWIVVHDSCIGDVLVSHAELDAAPRSDEIMKPESSKGHEIKVRSSFGDLFLGGKNKPSDLEKWGNSPPAGEVKSQLKRRETCGIYLGALVHNHDRDDLYAVLQVSL